MKSKALTVRSISEVTENRAKWRQVSGHSPYSRGRSEGEKRGLRRGLSGNVQARSAPEAGKRLLSWKEIAGYLHCTIRSVQRWEHGEGLPVHRHVHQKGSTVYAYSNELDAWLWTRSSLKSSHASTETALTARARLYVLPFIHSGNDPQGDSLCDGLTEEIIFQLAKLDPQRVGIIARSTSMGQKSIPKTIAEVGRRFGVSWVMEGCLRASGSHLRITAQLIRVSDQTQVWTECFDGEASDALQFQMEIARQIVQSMKHPGLLVEESVARTVAPNLDAGPKAHFPAQDRKAYGGGL
jgi:TolB-like protein